MRIVFFVLVAFLASCASVPEVSLSDGCAVWGLRLSDKTTESGVRDIVVTVCSPSLPEQLQKFSRDYGDLLVSVLDVTPCRMATTCEEKAKAMLQELTRKVVNRGDEEVKKILTK